jgi:hypothetical protein
MEKRTEFDGILFFTEDLSEMIVWDSQNDNPGLMPVTGKNLLEYELFYIDSSNSEMSDVNKLNSILEGVGETIGSKIVAKKIKVTLEME